MTPSRDALRTIFTAMTRAYRVDERLRVRGIQGLRVADCSVMPTQVSGNTNGPVMALAWRAAELIQGAGD